MNCIFRHHGKGSLSWYKTDLLKGNHQFKTGFDIMEAATRTRMFLFARVITDSGSITVPPFEMATFNYPVVPENLARYLGIYIQDSWSITRRTFSPGFCRFRRWAQHSISKS